MFITFRRTDMSINIRCYGNKIPSNFTSFGGRNQHSLDEVILCKFKAHSTGSVIQPWNGEQENKKARNVMK